VKVSHGTGVVQPQRGQLKSQEGWLGEGGDGSCDWVQVGAVVSYVPCRSENFMVFACLCIRVGSMGYGYGKLGRNVSLN